MNRTLVPDMVNNVYPFVSVIIPTLHRDEPLQNVLNYFLNIDKYPAFEVIVVDQSNWHKPTTLEYLSRVSSKIIYLRVDYKNISKARNHGVKLARGEIVLFADDDVEPGMGFISAHVSSYANPQIMGVTGPLISPGGKLKNRDEIGEKNYRALLARKAMRFDVDFEFSASWASTSNASFRKGVIERLGGFDENFLGLSIGEDAEFCDRLKKNNGIIYYNPYAYVIHRQASTGGCRDEVGTGKSIQSFAYNSNYLWFKIGYPAVYRYCKLGIRLYKNISVYRPIFKGPLFYYVANFIRGVWRSQRLICNLLKNGQRQEQRGAQRKF